MTDGRYIPEEIPDHFWALLSELKVERSTRLKRLEKYGQPELLRFLWNYEEAAEQLKPDFPTSDDFSEDSLDELVYWIVAQGAEYYKNIWDEPGILNVDIEQGPIDYHSDPGICSDIISYYRKTFGESVPIKQDEEFVE